MTSATRGSHDNFCTHCSIGHGIQREAVPGGYFRIGADWYNWMCQPIGIHHLPGEVVDFLGVASPKKEIVDILWRWDMSSSQHIHRCDRCVRLFDILWQNRHTITAGNPFTMNDANIVLMSEEIEALWGGYFDSVEIVELFKNPDRVVLKTLQEERKKASDW